MPTLLNNKLDSRKICFTLLAGLVLVFAFSLRLTAVTSSAVDHPIRADAKDYVMYAYNMRQHDTYSRSVQGYEKNKPPAPDAVRSPGYPIFLSAFIHEISFLEIKRALFAQALLSSLTIILIYFVGRFFMPAGWALLASLLAAISPHLINANIYLLTETLFAFSLALTLMAAVAAIQFQKAWPWLLVGLFLGITSLVRPVMQYFPVMLALLLFIQLPRRTALLASLLMFLGFIVPFGPWLIRNLITIGQTSDPTLMINFLHHGMYPGFEFSGDIASYGYPYHFDPDSAAISQSVATVLQEIWRRFIEFPVEHLSWFLFGKPLTLWSWNIVQGAGDSFIYPVTKTPYGLHLHFQITHLLSYFTHWTSVLLAFIGSILCWVRPATHLFGSSGNFMLRILSLILIYITAIHMIGAPFPRYAIPFRPIVYIMATAMLWQLMTLTLQSRLFPSRHKQQKPTENGS